MSAPTVITCPDLAHVTGPSVFLAGGISGCPDWQTEAAQYLPPWVTVFNPRRDNFPIDDPAAGPAQMDWEARHLHAADAILFWFPAPLEAHREQPISFYELGLYVSGLRRPAAVGVDYRFTRALDVRHQLRLALGDDFPVWSTLAGTCEAAVAMLEQSR